ncbi:PAS domain S-box protein [Methanobacterium sp.]|uniref:PAS domain S-box protein n=1 Tax=Methanobacterium sp. TaxID=2164 RepID=UPI003C7206DE
MVKSDQINNRNYEEYRQYSEMVSTIFELNPDAISLTRASDGKIIDCNPEYLNQIGYSREEVIGHTSLELELFNFKERQLFVNEIRKKQSISDYEIKVKRKDNSFIIILYSAKFINVDGIQTILSIGKDITERKQIEEQKQKILENEQQLTEELQSSNEELQSTTEELLSQTNELQFVNNELLKSSKLLSAIYELNPDAIVLTTVSDSKIIDCNQEYLNQIGYTRDETIGHTSEELNLINKVTREAYIDETRGNNKVSNIEIQGRRKDGSFIDVAYSTRQITVNNIPMILNIGHDITESKKAEKQLKFDSLLLSQVTDAVFAFDNNFKITYWNKGAEKMFGYTQKEALGTNSVELLRPNYTNVEIENKLREVGKKKILTNILYVKHKNGNDITVDQNVSLIVNDLGLQTGYVVVDRDITEKIKIEHELKESEEKYRNIVELANEGIMIADTSGHINFVNAKMAEMLGYSSEELLGTNAKSLVSKENRNLGLQKIENRKKGIQESYNIKYIRKNGEELWCLISASPMYDYKGKHIGNMTMQTDITESKKATDALLESESRFHSVLDNSQDVIYRINVQTGNYEYVSPSTKNVLGYSPEELIALIAKNPLNTIHPDDRSKFQKGIKKLEQNDKVEMEYRHQTKNGGYCWISNKIGLIRDNTGKPLYRDGNMRDITKRKQIEKQIEAAMDELRRSNEELERFAYVSSHDLQEPLRMVKLYSQLLERRYKDNLDSDADDFIEYIVEGANRMKQLIDDLLEYSRVNSKAKEFVNVDIEKVLNNVLRNLSISITEYNVKISHDPLPTVFADQNQMIQVFQNLITNAIKFHGSNPPEINISVQKDKKEWKFVVKDNGIGIDLKHQQKIFEVFKRLHTRDQYPGTGIGLSITQKIIIHHGGQIWVESQPGKGSTFYFTIPHQK